MIKTLSDVHRWIFSERLLISAGELEIGKLVQIRPCPRQSSAVSPSYRSRKSLETFANIVIIFWAGGKKRQVAKLQKHNQSSDLMSALLSNLPRKMNWIQTTNTNTKLQSHDIASAVLSDPTPTAVCWHTRCLSVQIFVFQHKAICFQHQLININVIVPKSGSLYSLSSKTERFTN